MPQALAIQRSKQLRGMFHLDEFPTPAADTPRHQTQRRCTEVRRICEWLSPLLTLDRAKRLFSLPMTHAYPRFQFFFFRLLLVMYVPSSPRYHDHVRREKGEFEIANSHWPNRKDPPPHSSSSKFLRIVHLLRQNLSPEFSITFWGRVLLAPSRPFSPGGRGRGRELMGRGPNGASGERNTMAGRMWDRPNLRGQQFGTHAFRFSAAQTLVPT